MVSIDPPPVTRRPCLHFESRRGRRITPLNISALQLKRSLAFDRLSLKKAPFGCLLVAAPAEQRLSPWLRHIFSPQDMRTTSGSRSFPNDPRNGTEEIITSAVSKAWPIPDAGLGAVACILEILMAVMGDRDRWRTMPPRVGQNPPGMVT